MNIQEFIDDNVDDTKMCPMGGIQECKPGKTNKVKVTHSDNYMVN